MTRLQIQNGAATPEIWRLLPNHVGDSEHHMLLTDRLVRSASVHGPQAWWHATNTATVLVGPSLHRVHKFEAPVGIRVVRRPTGGGAVLVGPGVVGLDVALPATHSLLKGDIISDYRWIGGVWECALRSLGIEATSINLQQSRDAAAKHGAYRDAGLACFALPAPYEVVAGDRKLVGLSQVRRGGGVLFSSAVHVDADPQAVVCALPLDSARRRRLASHLSRHAASLADVAHHPITATDVMEAVRSSLFRLLSVRLKAGSWPEALSQPASAAAAL